MAWVVSRAEWLWPFLVDRVVSSLGRPRPEVVLVVTVVLDEAVEEALELGLVKADTCYGTHFDMS